MAKTVDELVLKVTAEGTAQIKETTAAMDNLAASANKTGASTKEAGGNIRNVAFQVQDLAVQIAGGTSAFVAFGQQLPQLLGGFGVLGAVIGAVAAVSIPLFRIGLQAIGVDMRDLSERTRDLSTSVKDYQAAQQANQSTLAGLGNSFGSLTSEAKRFFDLNEQLTKQKALIDLNATIIQTRKEYGFLNDEVYKVGQRTQIALGKSVDFSIWSTPAKAAIEAKLLGLTVDQARELGNRLKSLDENTPEKNLSIITSTAEWLSKSNIEADKQKKIFDDVIIPLTGINKLILDMNKNVKESAQQATAFNVAILTIQNKFSPDIASARRDFDQIRAVRLEGEMKIAEFTKQIRDKESKDQVNRSQELAAFTLRTNQDVNSKIKDIAKAQQEAFNASELTNFSKQRTLGLEGEILSIQDKKRYSLSYEIQYEQDLARNRKEQRDTLGSLAEQLRKNVISVDQALTLEDEAYKLRLRSDDIAEKTRQKRKADAYESQQQVLFEGDARRRAVEYDIAALAVRQKMRQAYPEDIDSAVNIAKIKNDQFEAEMKINREMEVGKISREDALQRIAKTNDEMTRLLELERERTKEAQRYRTASFGEGATDAVSKIIRDNLTAYQKAGKMVEAVYANMGSAIDNFVDTGKFKFADFSRSVINDLIKIQLKADITSVLGAGLKFLGFNIPGRASGGPVFANSPYMVGENGPELFIPRTSGSIVPNGASMAGGGGGTSITYNISAVDTNSFKQLIAKDPSFIYAVTEQGRKNIPQVRR
jgi:hypothetical protein